MQHLDGAPETVRFLPLAREGAGNEIGWCTYEANLAGAPDVEILCGGKNSKLPSAAAIWRQGFLLHFGFQPDPSQLNETGRDLLENCIRYIAKFREDRPLGRVRSPFAGGPRPELRRWLESSLKNPKATAESLSGRFLEGECAARVAALADADALAWFRERLDVLVPQESGKLAPCTDLTALGLDVREAGFVAAALALLASDDAGAKERICRVLARHVPEGPVDGSAAAWLGWLRAHRDVLFFSDDCGCVWLVDALAKARSVPSADLRGPARADL